MASDTLGSGRDIGSRRALLVGGGLSSSPGGDLKIALMQPYFFPYVGYFDLVASSDIFVFYDDAAFSKNGWYNRNRILSRNKEWEYIRVSVRRGPLGSQCNTITLHDKQADLNRTKALLQVYAKAPFWAEVMALVDAVFANSGETLASVAAQSVIETCKYLELPLQVAWSSELNYDRGAPALAKILQICKHFGATDYVNAPGGQTLYNSTEFAAAGLKLHFTRLTDLSYAVEGFNFVPNLSIIDVLMWLSPSEVRQYLSCRMVG